MDRSKVANVKIYDRALYIEILKKQLQRCWIRQQHWDIDVTTVAELLFETKVAMRMNDDKERCAIHYVLSNEIPEYIYDFITHINRVQDSNEDDEKYSHKNNNRLKIACIEKVVLKLLELYPTSSEVKMNGRDYPLHLAIQSKVSENVVLKLIDLYPLAVLQIDSNGNYPLVGACRNGSSAKVILKLLEIYPTASQVEDNMGDYPLHLAIKCKVSEQVVLMLMELYPTAIQVEDSMGEYPLHLAIMGKFSETVVLTLMEVYPTATHIQDNMGEYPLHMAIKGKFSERVLLKLIELYPAAVEQRDWCGNYEIVGVCMNGSSEPVLLKLLQIYPQVQHDLEEYSLHLSLQGKFSNEVLLKLIQFFPRLNQRHAHRLIGACYTGCSDKLLRKILANYPTKENWWGEYPLYLAIQSKVSEQVVLKLIELYPHAVQERGLSGIYPLKWACLKLKSDQVIVKMVELFPAAAVQQQRNRRVQSAIDLAHSRLKSDL